MSKKNGDFNWKESISLKEYFDMEISSLKGTIRDSMDYQKEALRIASAAMEKRLDGMNEIREALRDSQMNCITKLEYDAKHELLNSKIEILQKIIYIGIGLCLAIEIILRFIK